MTGSRLPRVARALCVAVLTGLLVPGAHADADVAALVAELGLEEAPERVDRRPGWAAPTRVVVLGLEQFPGAQWLGEAAPNARIAVASTRAEAIALARDADVFIGLCNAQVLDAAPRVRWIQHLYAGVENCVSAPALRERGVLLTNMQRAQSPVIAEHAIALMLALARGLDRTLATQARGEWDDGVRASGRLRVLHGKTLFVAGLGGIGTEVARRAHALGMRVVATRAQDRTRPEFVAYVGLAPELPALVKQADVIVDALPLTDATRGLFDARVFAAMKPSALFVNVGRGGTVVTEALSEALRKGTIAGAGLDVTDPEPLPPDHPLWRAPNLIITPHVAALSDVGAQATWQIARENLRRYAAGERMLSVVEPTRGY